MNQTTEYDTDILIWSEHQAELLRKVANSDALNETPDWANIAEEIESVGRSELHAVESLLVQAILHGLKVDAWPLSLSVPHWEAEARGFRRDAARRFTPGMRQRIDIAALYAEALYRLPDTIDGEPPLPVAQTCPVTLDDLLEG
jgi:hypothetical protein